MAKITLDTLSSIVGNETSSLNTINENFDAVEVAFENTLSRDGTSPNSMNSNFDMNSFRIQNLPKAISGTEPLRKAEFDASVFGSVESIYADLIGSLAYANPIEPQFGGVGNGVADDTAAVQAAVDSLTALGGGTSIINNVHETTASIVIDGDVAITIYSPHSYLGVIVADHASDVIQFTGTLVGTNPNIRIENLCITKKSSAASGGTAIKAAFTDINSGSYKGIEILGCWITRQGSSYFNTAIDLTRCTHATIERNFLAGQGGTASTKVGSGIDLNTWCQGLTVHNNKIRGFLNGLNIDDISIDVAEDFQSEGYSIRGNTVSNCTNGLVSSLTSTEVSWLIQGNSFDCTTYGVKLDNLVRVQINDNRFGWNGGHTHHVDIYLRRTDGSTEVTSTLQTIASNNRAFRKGDLELTISGVTRGVTTTVSYTSVSKSRSITGITKANPCVVTYSGGDAFSEADSVTLSGIVGMTQLNGYTGRIQNVNTTSNTFELAGVDSTSFSTYTSGGTVALNSATGTIANGDIVYLYGMGGITQMNSKPVIVASLNTGAGTFVAKDYETGLDINSSAYTAFSSNGTLVRYGRFVEIRSGSDIDVTNNQITFRNVGLHLWDKTQNVLWSNNRVIGRDDSSIIEVINNSDYPTTLMITPFGASTFSRTLRDFGAKPDNVDNTAYIQAAIDWSSSVGGTVTDGDPGTFTCLSSLEMKDNTSFVLGPQTRIEGAFDGDLVSQPDDNVAIDNLRLYGGEWGKDSLRRSSNVFHLNMNNSILSGCKIRTYGRGKAVGFIGDYNIITNLHISDPLNDTGSGGIRCTGGRGNTISSCYAESGDDLFQFVPAINGTVNVISSITKANPAVVTYTGADNWANGDVIFITGCKGMTELNGRSFTVANRNTGANTFELAGENSTSYGTYTSGGLISSSAWDNRDIEDSHFVGCTGEVLYARACNAGLDASEYAGLTITSITKANPGVVTTSAAHGYTTGQTVRLYNTNGMVEVEDVTFTITVLTTTTFSIGVNTTTYGTYTDPADPDDRGYVINFDLTTMSASIRNCSFSNIKVRSEGRIALKSVNFDSLGEINGLVFEDITVDMRDAPVTYPDGRVNNKSAITMMNQTNLSMRDIRIIGTPARLFTFSSVDGLRLDNVGSPDVARNINHTGTGARFFSCKDIVIDRMYIAATPFKTALEFDHGSGNDSDEYDTLDTDPVRNVVIRGLKIIGMTDADTVGGLNAAIASRDGTNININGFDIRKSTDAAYSAYCTNIRAATVTAPADVSLLARFTVENGDVSECAATIKFGYPSAHYCRARNLHGWVTENRGTGQINAGALTSGNVAHGLPRTPNASQIRIVPTSDPTNACGPWYVTSITGTNFVVKTPVNCTAAMTFSWHIDATEYV